MNADAQAGVTLITGAAALRLGLTDAYLRYVKPSLQPWLITAGVILVVLGISGIVTARRLREAREAEPEEPDEGHGHGFHAAESHAPPGAAWLLVLPVLAIFLISPAPLGSYAASRSSAKLTAPKAAFPPLRSEVNGAIPLTLREYSLRAAYDDTDAMGGKTVRLTGFITPHGKDEFFLTRFVLNCCAADGVAIKVRLLDLPPPAPSADQWFEITGTPVEMPRNEAGQVLLNNRAVDFRVVSMRPIPQPTQAYES